jgi:hypothetical protein
MWLLKILTGCSRAVRKQIQHMIKYRYVPFTIGKARYTKNSA